MKSSAMFDLPLRHKPWRPGLLRWTLQDLAGVARQPEQDHRSHLRAGLEWLCRAQDACDGGVAGGWTFEAGWLGASEEGSSRLIETLLPAADYLAWPELAERARALLAGLRALPDDGAPARIHGLVAGHAWLGDPDCLAQAVASAQALCDRSLQAPADYAGAAHALAVVGRRAGDDSLLETARRHLEAALALQSPCGWFPAGSVPAATGELAGLLRSLIEAARLLDEPRARLAALRMAHGLRGLLRSDGWLSGAFDDGWMPAASHACIAGLTQLAAAWLRLAQISGDAAWREPAWRALSWVKRNHHLEDVDPALCGALPSAVPLWAGASAFRCDALTQKYFADALMMDMVGIAIPVAAVETGA
jgi:hypothetical protein